MLEAAILLLAACSFGLLAWCGASHWQMLRAARKDPLAGRRALLAALPMGRWPAQIAIVALVVGATWALTGHLLLCFLLLAGGVLLPGKVYAWQRERRRRLIDSQVPDILSMMAGAMRAGASLMSALDSVARDGMDPLRREVDLLLREVRLGIDLDVALDHLARRVGSPEMDMVAAAVKISRESGGNLSEALDNLARTTRERQNMEKKVLALTAQGRMQAWVMAGLPFFMLYMLHQLDPEAMAPMFHTLLGWAVFLAVCFWVWIGFKAITKVMSIDI